MGQTDPVKRHQARVLAVQAVYAADMQGCDPSAALEALIENEPAEESVASYARQLAEGVRDAGTAWTSQIEKVLSSWSIDRVTHVERCILRVALVELSGRTQVPPLVAIDEAIQLSKEYGTKNSEKFINGVLDAIWKKTGQTA